MPLGAYGILFALSVTFMTLRDNLRPIHLSSPVFEIFFRGEVHCNISICIPFPSAQG